jgi:hypothetical protein
MWCCKKAGQGLDRQDAAGWLWVGWHKAGAGVLPLCCFQCLPLGLTRLRCSSLLHVSSMSTSPVCTNLTSCDLYVCRPPHLHHAKHWAARLAAVAFRPALCGAGQQRRTQGQRGAAGLMLRNGGFGLLGSECSRPLSCHPAGFPMGAEQVCLKAPAVLKLPGTTLPPCCPAWTSADH